jgi:RHS repeat-associated protein
VLTDALGYAVTTAYDAAGNTLSVTDQNSHVTSYAYDADNRKTTQTDACGTGLARTTTTAYDQVGNVQTVTDALNHTTSYTYDSLNRQITATDPLGHVTSTTYDAASNVQTVKTPLNLVTSYGYDAQNRQISVTDPLSHTTTTLYDGMGNVAQTSDALGHATAKRYDQLGQDAGSTSALSQVTQQNYDAAGNLLSVTDPVGNVTSYVYDVLNRQIETIDPTGAITTTSYDAAGRVTQVVDRDGRTVSYAYDADSREIGETWKSSTGSIANTLTFTYDPKGDRLTASNNAGTVSYSYDALDRVAAQTDVFGLTTTYNYDALDRQTSMQDSLGGVLTTVYDSAGRQTSQQFGGTGQTPARVDLGYDSQNRLSTVTRYTDLAGSQLVGTTAYGYDNASNLQSITNKSGTAVTLSYYNYTYDSANRVSTESHSSTVGTTVYSGTNTYTYDSTNQLLSTGSETFTYDANGNRTTSGYTTGADNRTTTDGVYTYTYDSAGNLIEKCKGSGLETWYYGYDNKNMLTSVRETSNGTTNELTTTYTYDALGAQVSQAESKMGGSTVTTRHAYDDHGNAWADLTSGDAVVMRYLRVGPANQMLAQIDGSGNLSWYLTDNPGSVRDIVNAAGTTVTDHIDYSAFGGITLETNSAATGRAYLYTALPEDRDTGIVQAQHRSLLVTTGQWMQEDPLAFQAGDPNLYRYVGNNTPNLVDPAGTASGHEDWDRVRSPSGRGTGGLDGWDVLKGIGVVTYDFTVGPFVNDALLIYDFSQMFRDPYYRPQNPNLAAYMGQNASGSTKAWACWAMASDIVIVAAWARSLACLGGKAARAAALADLAADEAAESSLGSCFLAGTLVSTPAGLRAIDTLKPGNEVWAYDHVSSCWRIRQILETFESHHEGLFADISVAGETIPATFLHPFWAMRGENLDQRPRRPHLAPVPIGASTGGRWVDACDLVVGDVLLLQDGREVIVEATKHYPSRSIVYNIEVAGLHCYAVGKSSVLVHNGNGPPTGGPTPPPPPAPAPVPPGPSAPPLTQREASAISKIHNIIRDHLKGGPKGDIAGTISDMVGNPIAKPSGGFWDHVSEMNDTVKGLQNAINKLQGSTNPAAISARDRAMSAIKNIEDATQGAGL